MRRGANDFPFDSVHFVLENAIAGNAWMVVLPVAWFHSVAKSVCENLVLIANDLELSWNADKADSHIEP